MEKEQKQPWFLCVPTARYRDIVFDDNYKYDYRLQILLDIHDYCIENCLDLDITKRLFYGFSTAEEVENELFDMCIKSDSVTGNPSGSYWFSSWYAELALCHNWDLLTDALFEFGDASSFNFMDSSPEELDVKIRIFLLGDCIHEYVNEIIRCYVQN